MLSVKIIKSCIFVFLSQFAFSQVSNTNDGFIEYKFPFQVDSLITEKLDSIDNKVIEDNLVINCDFNCIDAYTDYDEVFSLIYLENYRDDTVHFYHYLAKNSNRYYVSDNMKYKIPIVLSDPDKTFKADYIKYPYALSDEPRYILLKIEVKWVEIKSIDLNKKIPEFMLKKN